MALYFFITYAALTITFYAAFLVDGYHLPKTFSGVLISLFFLAIMAPGLILDRIIGIFKGYTNVAAIAMIGAGLFCFGIFRDRGMLVVGASLAGFGYGLMQPLIYDKTAIIAPPRAATLALSFVMAVNYLAIMLCPFLPAKSRIMEKNLVYTTCGTCSKLLDVTVENDRVKRVQFIGGCHGNSQGIAALIAGMEVDEAIARLSGIDCGGRGTSCPDQLAKALTQLKNSR